MQFKTTPQKLEFCSNFWGVCSLHGFLLIKLDFLIIVYILIQYNIKFGKMQPAYLLKINDLAYSFPCELVLTVL